MRKFLLSVSVAIFLILSGCSDEEPELFTESGTVIDFSGSGNCGIAIQLENGTMIQPKIFPTDFVFADGQHVEVNYLLLKNSVSGCEKGSPCEIHSIRQTGCAPYVNLSYLKYDSLKNDPVQLHEAYIDGDCLHIKLSYSGGCRTHSVGLARIFPECGTPPLPPPTFEIRHKSNGDACEAYITKDYRFDLSPLKKEGTTKVILNAKVMNGFFSKTFDYPLK